MENRKALLFTFSIVALILAVTLFRQFDFLTLTFEKTGPAIVYIIGLLIAVVILVKNARER
ncbi:MAG TPA: hypothetical protein VHK69_05310 [Chitinophagaceae bacterium]|nr:hypothetical protein [Chitinophagaceae bacterium]